MIKNTTIEFIKDTYLGKEHKINPTAYFYDLNIIKENIN